MVRRSQNAVERLGEVGAGVGPSCSRSDPVGVKRLRLSATEGWLLDLWIGVTFTRLLDSQLSAALAFERRPLS